MDKLVSTSLIEMLKQRLEVARLKNAYAHGALDHCMNDSSDAEGYIQNKYGL